MTEPKGTMADETLRDERVLDNPIWHSLMGAHAGVAEGTGRARKYASTIGPLSGVAEETAEACAELGPLVPPGDVAVLFLQNPPQIPPGWELVRGGMLVQMICRKPPAEVRCAEEIVPLTAPDNAEMVDLATLTEPGPFRERTATLGRFIGIRVEGRLAAMAGERLQPGGFIEVSAVCTHPDFRGRGFAGALVAAAAHRIQADGRVAFLTALATNSGAIRVYEQLGFELRRQFHLAVLRPGAAG